MYMECRFRFRAVPSPVAKSRMNDFPKYGITLAGIDEFIDQCGGYMVLSGLTTTEISEMFIKPLTRQSGLSYCEHYLMHATESHHPVVDIPTVFVSYAWRYEFLKVVDAIRNTINNDHNVVLWFDIFSNSQHESNLLRPFDWWCSTFMTAIQSIGHVIMVLEPWVSFVVD